ncbi:SDR family NAD(P)-dependent oxidoreductase [Paractinoplanes maris]|uniref:SDR family NAD(P)-dependent oxidoreductase n=1 Tax=Paractinoplanes maris TaxID=1734446 RepID=UPI002021773E|nr:SDR family NAD(P)-dependent oxidoreductase [Actinoplanes maris]
MTTIAIIGAGPGLGAAVARRFGAEGLGVALVARTPEKLDHLAGELTDEGLTARGYPADVRDTKALADALGRAAADLGPIEVLQYSPLPQKAFLRPVLETTTDDLRAAVEFSILGPVTAVQSVLPGMRELGRGSVLFVNGGSGARPNPKVAGTSIAFAGEGAYATMLHDTLAADGIHVGQLIVPGAITPGHPTHDPGVLADRLWQMHTARGEFRVFAEPLP